MYIWINIWVKYVFLVKLEQLKNKFLNVDLIIINKTMKIFSMTLLFSKSNGTSRLPSLLLISTLYLLFSLILLLLITQELDSDGILLFHAILFLHDYLEDINILLSSNQHIVYKIFFYVHFFNIFFLTIMMLVIYTLICIVFTSRKKYSWEDTRTTTTNRIIVFWSSLNILISDMCISC